MDTGKAKFNGKIQQLGLCPVGFRTITVPAINTSHFIWRNRKTYGNQLLIFPPNANLDAVSYDDFEVYIFSIEESYLFQMLEYLGYLNAKKFFDGDEKYIDMNDSFVRTFQQKADELINNARFDVTEGTYKNTEVQNFQFDDILILLLRFLENQSHWIKKLSQRRRDVALKKAVSFIHNELQTMPTLS